MDNYKNRKLFDKIIKYLDTKEMLIIHGARQVGKTTLMRMLQDYLIKRNIPKSNIIYWDMEDIHYFSLLNTGVDNVMDFIIENGVKRNKKIYLFIDEVQYINNVSSFLKLFYDRYGEKCKLIVSGSSSFEIRKKFKNSLTGRFFPFQLNSLDFEEFLRFKNIDYNINKPITSDIIKNKVKKLFEEYIIWGGYPRIPFFKDIEIKYECIKGIINTYIFKDIRDIGQINNIQKFNDLLVFLAHNSGLLNISNISREIGLNRNTLSNYIFILENTYIIKRIFPYHNKHSTEIKKMPKIYFEDTGIRNFLIGKLKNSMTKIMGNMLENSVFNILKNKYEKIYYWRNKHNNEIDFIVKDGREIKAFEVKITYTGERLTGMENLKRNKSNLKSFVITLNNKNKFNKPPYKVLYPWEI